MVKQSDEIKLIIQSGSYETQLAALAFNENLSIAIFYDINGEIEEFYNPNAITTLQQAYNMITASNKEYEQYNEETENEDGLLACISYFTYNNQVCYVYVNSPLVGSAIALAINQYQVIIASSLTMIFGVIIAFFFSQYLSKPIRDLNDSAFLLSNGDYTVNFQLEGYDEIKQLGNSLNKAKDELMKTDTLQKEFIANVSHDLRTPLTIIQSYAEMIRDISGENKEKREKHLDIIIGEVNRLSSLVTDVLELSKLKASHQELKLEKINISNLVTQVIDKVKLPITNNKIKLTTNLDKKAFALVDEVQFNQVIYNYILNAITYTKSEIIVSVLASSEYILFTVSDNGEGIKQEDILNIWDRYYRSKENHERHKHGSGLGLSIVKNILENHKFDYGVDSKYGNGAMFYVKLPINK